MKCVEKLKLLVFLERKLQKIHGIRNHMIWIIIHREIKELSQDRKIDHEERENAKISITSTNLLFKIEI